MEQFLTHEICGYEYTRFTDGFDEYTRETTGTAEEGFLTPDEAAVLIVAPRQIAYFYGAKLERLERDLRGRVISYSAGFWDGPGRRGFLEIRAVYSA